MTKLESIQILKAAEAHLHSMSSDEMVRLLETAGIDDSILSDQRGYNTTSVSVYSYAIKPDVGYEPQRNPSSLPCLAMAS